MWTSGCRHDTDLLVCSVNVEEFWVGERRKASASYMCVTYYLVICKSSYQNRILGRKTCPKPVDLIRLANSRNSKSKCFKFAEMHHDQIKSKFVTVFVRIWLRDSVQFVFIYYKHLTVLTWAWQRVWKDVLRTHQETPFLLLSSVFFFLISTSRKWRPTALWSAQLNLIRLNILSDVWLESTWLL